MYFGKNNVILNLKNLIYKLLSYFLEHKKFFFVLVIHNILHVNR